jgi:hypothetical protein
MKIEKISLILVLIIMNSFSIQAQNNEEEKLNLPGDNLNLYAVLNLFQESETLELFEKNLNAEDSKINNLDLNNDDKIDYIKVVDNVEGDTHLIVLQVAINEKENQDELQRILRNICSRAKVLLSRQQWSIDVYCIYFTAKKSLI